VQLRNYRDRTPISLARRELEFRYGATHGQPRPRLTVKDSQRANLLQRRVARLDKGNAYAIRVGAVFMFSPQIIPLVRPTAAFPSIAGEYKRIPIDSIGVPAAIDAAKNIKR